MGELCDREKSHPANGEQKEEKSPPYASVIALHVRLKRAAVHVVQRAQREQSGALAARALPCHTSSVVAHRGE